MRYCFHLYEAVAALREKSLIEPEKLLYQPFHPVSLDRSACLFAYTQGDPFYRTLMLVSQDEEMGRFAALYPSYTPKIPLFQ